MHSILITFKSVVSPEEMAGPATEIAKAMLGVKGLISKTWIAEGSTLGGFYVFSDKSHADAYLSGEIVAGLRENPALSEFNARHFNVMEEWSVLNGTPDKALAARR